MKYLATVVMDVVMVFVVVDAHLTGAPGTADERRRDAFQGYSVEMQLL